MVAKFPKSSASAPLCHFLPATANAFSHPPKSSAFATRSEKFDRGNSQRRQGNPAQLATASLPSPIDPRASRSLARHRRIAVAGPIRRPRLSPSPALSTPHTHARRQQESLPVRPGLPLLNPPPLPPATTSSPAVAAPARPQPPSTIASCLVLSHQFSRYGCPAQANS